MQSSDWLKISSSDLIYLAIIEYFQIGHSISETGSVSILRKWEHGTYSGGSVTAHNRISTSPLFHWGLKRIQYPKCCILFGIMDDGKVQKPITLRVLPPHLTSCCPLYMENPRFASSSSGCIVGLWNECRSFPVCRATCLFSLQPQHTGITEEQTVHHGCQQGGKPGIWTPLYCHPQCNPPPSHSMMTSKNSLKWLQRTTARKFCKAFTYIHE
jgi:hypothetical protein